MEPDRFDSLVRALFTTPSRRVLNRALVGLATGTLLAPLLGDGDAAADKKGKNAHRRKEKRRNKRKKKKVSKKCAKNYTFCPAGQGDSAAGELSGCCWTDTDIEGDPYEVCTECGCCPYDSTCCVSGGDSLCCPSGSKCSHSPDFQTVGCCSSTDKVCHGGCCGQGEDCCLTPAPGNIPYCCAVGLKCKIQGPYDITCQAG